MATEQNNFRESQHPATRTRTSRYGASQPPYSSVGHRADVFRRLTRTEAGRYTAWMTDQLDQPAPKRKRRRAAVPPGHLDVVPASVGQGVQAEAAAAPPAKRRAPRKRATKQADKVVEAQTLQPTDTLGTLSVEQVFAEAVFIEPATDLSTSASSESSAVKPESAVDDPAPLVSEVDVDTDVATGERLDSYASSSSSSDDTGGEPTSLDTSHESTADEYDPSSTHRAGPPSEPPHDPPAETHHRHGWVYLAMGLFVLALLFGAWGMWTTWFAHSDEDAQDTATLQTRNERLSQDVSTLKRSDQISREANRDLQRTLAERDEEIAGLRADVAFYERFVGATGQRRGLSVHDLEMQPQSDEAWHFVATLTQNLNRGAVNTGRLTVSVEGTRNDRLERLSWTKLRKENNAPGSPYSFKYFQQVEGDVILPKDFKPVRVIVRLVPAGGSAVEQSFTWAETLDRTPTP